MVRNIARALSLIALVLALVIPQAFATGRPETTAEPSVVELTVWFGRRDFIPADNFEAFHRQYPNIRVTADVIPLESAVADTLRAARARQAPDIVQAFNYDSQPLSDSGLLLDISSQLARWQREDPQGYNAVAEWGFEMGKVGGVPSGLGVHGGSRYLVYRKDLLEQHGLSVPQTWDDVLAVSRALANPQAGLYGVTLMGARGSNPSTELQTFFAMGGVWRNQDVPQIDSPAGHYLIRYYQTLAREGLIHPETIAWSSGEQRAAFFNGNAVFKLMGENILPSLQRTMSFGDKWGVTAPPYRPGAQSERSIPVIGFPYYVTSQTQHPYEASLVLRYLAQAEIVKEVALRYQPTSTQTAMNAPDFLQAQPWRSDITPYVNELFPYPAMKNAEASFEILKDLREEMMTNVTEDPRSMAARYQQRLNAARDAN